MLLVKRALDAETRRLLLQSSDAAPRHAAATQSGSARMVNAAYRFTCKSMARSSFLERSSSSTFDDICVSRFDEAGTQKILRTGNNAKRRS